MLYKVADTTPQHGYLQLPGFPKTTSLSTNIVPLDHPEHITRKVIQYPWLATELDQAIIKLQDQPFILKEYIGNTPKKMKLYLMPLERDKEIATAVKQIDGKLNLPIQMQQALNLQYLTLEEQGLAHIASIELIHDPKIGTYFCGFHYDPYEKLKNAGVINLQPFQNINNIVTVKAQLVKGGRIHDKSFFPSYWSLEKIVEKSQEALTNMYDLIDPTSARPIILGKTHCGIKIQFVFDKSGNIISFYPIT